MVNLKVFDLSYFRDKSDFEDGGVQNYLIFQQIFQDFNFFAKSSTTTESFITRSSHML